MNTTMNQNEIMVHLEDLTGEKLDWAIDSAWSNSVIIPVESLEKIALHLANQQKV